MNDIIKTEPTCCCKLLVLMLIRASSVKVHLRERISVTLRMFVFVLVEQVSTCMSDGMSAVIHAHTRVLFVRVLVQHRQQA